ncbi:hypothetical protein FKM82_012018 [Ascaphus truei]
MRQDLQYKENGYQTLKEIDLKMSGNHGGFKLDEAQAILSEMKAIKKAINSGEREKQDLIKSLARLKNGFVIDKGSQSDLWASDTSLAGSNLSLPRQYLNVSSQTDVSGNLAVISNNQLAEKVRLRLRYEEAKKRIANIKIQLAKLDSEAWPGVLDSERDRLILINEKEELLKEMRFVSPRKWSQTEVERLQTEKKRLETDLQAARDTQSKALTERLKMSSKRNQLIRELEETTRLIATLHTQLKSLSASTQSLSSGSSPGSLASSRGSLATSSQDSSTSASFTDLYYEQLEQLDSEYQNKVDFLLQEGAVGYRPSGCITTIHENEVAKPQRIDPTNRVQVLRSLTGTPKSITSLSPRSSLSSPSPPCSPLVTDPLLTGDAFLSHMNFDDIDLSINFSELGLSTRGDGYLLEAEDKIVGHGFLGASGLKVAGVSAAVSDESVAGDSGVYEATTQRLLSENVFDADDSEAVGAAKIKIGMKYDEKNKQFAIFIIQLNNSTALLLQQDQKVYVRVAVLPCSESTSCLFRTRTMELADNLIYNEMFLVSVSYAALRQKTLRVDVCTLQNDHREDCLGGAQISLADVCRSGEKEASWYNLLNYRYLKKQNRKNKQREACSEETSGENLDSVCALLEQTAVELEAVERRLGESRTTVVDEDNWQEEQDTVQDEEGGSENGEEEEYDDNMPWGTEDSIAQPNPESSPVKMDKETNTEGLAQSSAVRPKDKRVANPMQAPFMRGSTIIRSKTFSPGPQSQYICQLNRSDSDSSLCLKASFVRTLWRDAA